MELALGIDYGKQVLEALGISADHVVSFGINFSMNAVVTVTVERQVSKQECASLVKINEKWKAIERVEE